MIATWKDLACALAYVEKNGDVVPSLREGAVMNVEIDPAFLIEVRAELRAAKSREIEALQKAQEKGGEL